MRHSKIGSVMTGDVVRAEFGTPFKEVARLLNRHRISGLPVVDGDEKVIGVISETDLLVREARAPLPDPAKRRIEWPLPGRNRRRAKAHARIAGRLMSEPAITVHADASIAEAARTMARHRIERLPVVDEEDRLVGIVTRRDLLQIFLRSDREIRREVAEDVLVGALLLAPDRIGVEVDDGVVTLTGQLERRSEIPLALSLTRQIDGVVGVVDKLTYRIDDTRLEPTEEAWDSVAEGWLRKL
ncbi:CBS domain-containing protein [Streptomyces sp. KLOTTS4A1]|uniref:CBS domain-containing protein n=1 Tax=Streptomyces sp. KLOTTS4A1 TaxID=3390996 RepID=UPI0039F4FC23